jgi:hypothetical protein
LLRVCQPSRLRPGRAPEPLSKPAVFLRKGGPATQQIVDALKGVGIL